MDAAHTKNTGLFARVRPPVASPAFHKEAIMANATSKTATPKPVTSKVVAKAPSKPEPKAAAPKDEKPVLRLPKRAKADDVLIPGKPYTPRKNTKWSTRSQWIMLSECISAGNTVQQIVEAAAVRVKEHGLSMEASVTDAGYLDYVISRGWAVVKGA